VFTLTGRCSFLPQSAPQIRGERERKEKILEKNGEGSKKK
jgi:hypothetical protein